MEITYSQCGDYFIPDLILSQEEQQPIGKYGRMRKRYLKEHSSVLYTNLLLSGKLFSHLAEIECACEEQLELIVRQLAEQEGVIEALKASDQIEWVRRMNSIRNRSEEIVLHEIVFG